MLQADLFSRLADEGMSPQDHPTVGIVLGVLLKILDFD